jgi:predicted ATPase
VGRQTELALIGEKIDLTLTNKGQVVGVFAEAGMGKSRLVAEVIRIATEKNLLGYGGECQSYGMNTSYLVWQRIWQAFFNLNPDWSLAEQTLALEAQLALINSDLLPRLPLLGAVLNLPIPDNDLTRSFDAKLRKTSLEGLLVECLRVRSQDEALLLVLEDCHWMDPLSHELLEVIVRAMTDRPIIIIVAAREPELMHLQSVQFNKEPNYTEIELAEFSQDEARRLIELKVAQFFGEDTAVPPLLIEQIVNRAGGNPFYIEELLNYLQDRNLSPQDMFSLENLDLPASLHSLILSRIDQLTESQKSTIKVASVIGRLFRATMLWGAYPQLGKDSQVKTDLTVLSDLDLTPLDSPEPELTYLFKSIVTQEVAYESMPYATRSMLHDLVGQFIERAYADLLDQYIDLLAHHFEQSENEAKKRVYLLKAGEAAQADYNNTAAMTYYEKVLPLLSGVNKIETMLKLGNVLSVIGRWDEAGETYQEAMELARKLGNRKEEAWARTAVAELRRKQGQYAEASEWLEEAQATFEAVNDKAGVGQVLKQAGTVAAQQGDFVRATELYEKSLIIQREMDNKPEVANLLNNLGIVARLQSERTVASYLYNESLVIQRQLGDRRGIAVTLNNLGNLALDSKNYTEARRHLEEAVKLQKEVGDRAYIANALNNLGNVARAQEDYNVAQSLYNDSLIINQELGDKWALAYLLEDVGSLAVMQNKPERALRLIGAAFALREAIGAPRSASEQTKLDNILELAHLELNNAQYTAFCDEGRSLSLEQAIEYALTASLPELV